MDGQRGVGIAVCAGEWRHPAMIGVVVHDTLSPGAYPEAVSRGVFHKVGWGDAFFPVLFFKLAGGLIVSHDAAIPLCHPYTAVAVLHDARCPCILTLPFRWDGCHEVQMLVIMIDLF